MLHVLTNNGMLRETPNRVSSATHWDIYRRAEREEPDVLRAMYDTVCDIVSRRELMQTDGRFPNSSWIGSQVLANWPRQNEWNTLTTNNSDTSNALFGQIMWTVMLDHELYWVTAVTPNEAREERVYWLHPDSQNDG